MVDAERQLTSHVLYIPLITLFYNYQGAKLFVGAKNRWFVDVKWKPLF